MKTLLDLYKSHSGKVSDKWALYLREYDRLFAPYRDQAISMLEIGVQNGGSLEIWSQYFPSAQKFVGCDINPDCAQLRYEDPRIVVIVGDATAPETQAKVLEQSARFDLIIEDGSHTSSDIVKAFARYFPVLKTGGLFVAEDLHCSYWQEFEGGIFHPYSSITFFKHLTDMVNHEHWGVERNRTDLIAGFKKLLGVDFDESILGQIASVEFINSICVVRKNELSESLLGGRVIAGSTELVVEGHLPIAGIQIAAPNQSLNIWSNLPHAPAETYQDLVHEIKQTKELVAQLRNEVQAKQAEVAHLSHLLSAMQGSRSWRYTTALRQMGNLARPSVKLLRRIKSAARQNGGYAVLSRKVINVLRREGWQGLRWRLRNQHDHTKTEKTPQPWSEKVNCNLSRKGVLIIAELSIPQCRRYRVEQKVEGFAQLGMSASVVSWTDQVAAKRLMQTSAMVIFYRTPALPGVLSLLDEAHRLCLTSFFDIDDLVFDVEAYAQNSNLKKLPVAEQKNLLAGAELYCCMLRATDHAIASTPVLAERMQTFCRGNVYLVENALDGDLVNLSEEEVAFPATDRVIVGYGSGTRTHDADFMLASEGLLNLLKMFSEVDLVIFGYLELPDEFAPYLSRVRRVPFLAAHDYYRALRQFDINLAPLEAGVFNDAKSNIKFIEAAVFGIPTVASPCAAFKQVIRPGENGFLASNSAEWFASLAALVQSHELRLRVGLQAKRDVLAQYALSHIARSSLAPLIAASKIQSAVKRRIMVVNVLFSPISFGGATVVAEQLALGLAAHADTEVCVVTGCFDETLAPGEVRQYSWNGLSVFAIRLLPGSKLDEYDNPYTSPSFAAILDAVQPNLVHFHSIQILGANLANVCIDRNIPYLISLHDAWWLCELQFMVNDKGYCGQKAIDPLICATCVPDSAATYRRRFVLQRVLQKASKLLAPSSFQRELYVRSGLAADHVIVNKNGVLPSMIPVTGPRETGNKLVFAYMGGRATHKGYFWLQRIFETIEQSDYTLKLVDIQARFGPSNMANDDWKIKGELEITPPFEMDQIDNFYTGIDVLLFPSQWKESFGLTVREAMIRNIWVIATDCGGPVEDLVSGVNGEQYAMDDEEGFREAIVECIKNPERVKNYCNPLIAQVRTFDEQSIELSKIIDLALSEYPASS